MLSDSMPLAVPEARMRRKRFFGGYTEPAHPALESYTAAMRSN